MRCTYTARTAVLVYSNTGLSLGFCGRCTKARSEKQNATGEQRRKTISLCRILYKHRTRALQGGKITCSCLYRACTARFFTTSTRSPSISNEIKVKNVARPPATRPRRPLHRNYYSIRRRTTLHLTKIIYEFLRM